MNREERDVCERFEQSIDIVADIVEFRFSDGTVKRARCGLYMRDIEESLRKMLIDQMANEKKQEPCENCISRQAVNELVDELARAISDERCCISRGRSTATIMRDIFHLPPVTPQPCEDAISRQEVLDVISELNGISFYETQKDSKECYYEIRNAIKQLQPVTPQPKMGRWIPIEYDGYADGSPVWDKWECSECGYEHNGDEESLTAFCPDCGRKMEAEE